MDKNGDAEGNYTLISLENRPGQGHGLYPIGHFVGKEEMTSLPVSNSFPFFCNLFFFFFFVAHIKNP